MSNDVGNKKVKMIKDDKKCVFNLKEVGYTDLDGQAVKINFDQREFANTLFANAQSIEMDDFARNIHKTGEAELTDVLEQEFVAVIGQLYKYRVTQAIKETIQRLKEINTN